MPTKRHTMCIFQCYSSVAAVLPHNSSRLFYTGIGLIFPALPTGALPVQTLMQSPTMLIAMQLVPLVLGRTDLGLLHQRYNDGDVVHLHGGYTNTLMTPC